MEDEIARQSRLAEFDLEQGLRTTLAITTDPAARARITAEIRKVNPRATFETDPPAAAPVAAAETDGSSFASLVASEAIRLRVRDEGRALYEQQRELANPAPPFDLATVGEVLARPAADPYRVEDLIPANASTLIVAQKKTGKTTLVGNLCASLLTGTRFLGRFDVTPVDGRIAILNFEVAGAQLARWLYDMGVPADRAILANMRGRRNPLSNPHDRAALAQLLRDAAVEVVIVDPFGRAYGGTSQNDAGEVGAWLVGLDAFRAEAGASDLILTAHAGWNGERTRGSSALDDWADSIITITRDEESGARFLRAEGRDVHIDEDELLFDPLTRCVTLTGAGSRRQAATTRKVTDLLDAIVPILRATPGLSGVKVADALRESGAPFQRGGETKALRHGVDLGTLAVMPGPRGAKLYSLASTYPDIPRPTPAGDVTTYPDPPIGGGVSGVGPAPMCLGCGVEIRPANPGQIYHLTCEPEETP